MSFEEQFDKIINNKLNEAEFPFDEKNWDKASSLIDANRVLFATKNKSKNLLLFALAFILICGVGVFTYFQFSNSTAVISDATINRNNLNKMVANPSIVKTQPTDIKSEAKKMLALNNTSELATIPESSKNSKSDISLKEEIKKQNAVEHTENGELNKLTQSNSHNEKIAATNHTENISSPSSIVSENKYYTKNENVIVSNAGNDKGTTTKPLKLNTTSKILTVLDNNKKIETANISDPVLEIAETQNKEINNYEYLNPIAFKITTPEQECKNLNANFLLIYDNDYYKNTNRKLNYLNIEAGATYLLGWDADKVKDGVGLNYYAGINYGLYITKNVSFSAGIQGYSISNVKQPFFTATKTIYEFGATGTYTTIAANSLYYVAIPLKFNFAISTVSKFGVGLNTGFLVGGKNTIETYSKFDGVTTNLKSQTIKGFYEGTNTKNFILTANYSHKLNKRASVNGEFIYGLSDIFINTKTNTTKQSVVGFKLGLVVTLFDK